MGMVIEGKVGPQNVADGSVLALRLGKLGDTIVTELNPRYYEQVYRGNLFHGGNGVTGVAPGTAIGTTPPLALYNPANSKVNLVLVQTQLAYISGTIGAGAVFYCVNTGVTGPPSGGTKVSGMNALLEGNNSIGQICTGVTLPASPTPLRPCFNLGANTAATTNAPSLTIDNVEGHIIVPPGTILSLEALAAAGSSPLVTFGFTWLELPV